jgi:CRP-like cAMP-binding protein
MEAADVFGDMPLFDQAPRSVQARALESSELLIIPYTPLKVLLEERPQVLWKVVSILSRRLQAGDADEFVLPVTQEELAGLVGASRERVNKAISAFVRLGWIEQVDRRYRIIDRAQLAHRGR